MTHASDRWVVVLSRIGEDGWIQDDVRAWLGQRGIDWNPFTVEEARFDTYCTRDPSTVARTFSVLESALRRLGLS
ncbi:hypothetical protein [Nocardia seriolae]|uniref:Uncharacterized protein n=1 Tax=Nocardia seriolae TaxID=37332 RepID=A0ABC8B0Q3_9NOCA|nr:hypothetical protein [Nocardia seriolae]APA99988.1 hypothetical protein NS506_05952 [Nocardia seriolae]MTJ64670.1 hypothetical protein [Nocardia seriolae]MTJ73019.1 hypothetical protein [Nocardia seriolae]MTJ89513.1 hypothetical protein [Nocardia seriolae]MTK33488.1 hypothetical protein [Nocardia seriolae]